jgi:arsenite methyltransferase
MAPIEPGTDQASLKQCCANLYESDLARILLGDSFHPGGLELTARLGALLDLGPESKILDVASGRGASAIFLARKFGCDVLGVDYGQHNVESAREEAAAAGLDQKIRFERGDAESLKLPDASFDAIICECAFCTFPDKAGAAGEFMRLLRPGGKAGISDLTRDPALPQDLQGLLSWISCIADAQPIAQYTGILKAAGMAIEQIEPHDEALAAMVRQIGMRLLGAEVMAGLERIHLPGIDFQEANRVAKAALTAVEAGQLGYALITASKR